MQFQKDEQLYERLFGELFLYFYRNRERFRNWQAVVIYPTRSTEQGEIEPYRCLLESEQVHRVYLDELGKLEDLPLEVGILVLTTLGEEETPAAARYLLNRSQQELREAEGNNAIIEIITTILSYRFTRLSRLEIEAMLGITLQETRFYQDVKEEGKQVGKQEEAKTFVLRLLTKRFGEVPSDLNSQIARLSLEQLEALGEALLDFVSLDDLAVWLETE